MRKNYLYIVLISLIFSQSFAQDFRARVEVDSSVYLVGDYINVKYRIEYQDGINYSMPSIQDSLTDLTFIKELPVKNYDKDDILIDEYTYVFSAYDSAGIVIPSIKFIYADKNGNAYVSYSNEAALEVRTIEVDMQGDIQDVKSPLRIPLDWWSILIYLLILLAVAVLVYFIYQKFIKKKEINVLQKPIVIIPPHEIALKALRNLEDQKLWQQGKIKEYHSELTNIIRRYFEGRFNFLAMEMPSSEVLLNLKKIETNSSFFESAQSFFNNADLVKFAKFEPMPSINEQMMDEAYKIVDTTKETINSIQQENANV
ncbi:MAG: hypothetical protein QY331_12180 [Melioribacteraceae bacterium]|nr:MAG: hypothetical protein QY331_12180 [Melioribacteraceae bacterium]